MARVRAHADLELKLSQRDLELEVSPADSKQVLQLILAVSFDRETLSKLLLSSLRNKASVNLWPCSFYRMAAETTLHSITSWTIVKRALDKRLEPWAHHYIQRPPVETIRVFSENPDLIHGLELAGALWSLVRRRDPSLTALAERLASEFQLFAIQRLGQAS